MASGSPHQRLGYGQPARQGGRHHDRGVQSDLPRHGVTAYLENGGTLEKARQMAAHASIRTTQPYDRREDRVSLDEVVKINFRA
jgi:hypothetical protein